ncbi:rhodanese-like domain-containing protein [Tahibacter sp.]|uniref:rhodanese-like domain-containing protein n=1 Tax=Tahibacter sp. TaxID=2056211 RepID=UPI0028C38139|nr:rhodanese-like domain-containing protein [Tahibacter sp.]
MIAFLMGLPTIAPRALLARIQQRTVCVCDVNSLSSWNAAHVPGARRLDPHAYTAADLGAAPGAGIVFYCSGPLCRKAPIAARRAQQMGHTDVHVMSAGLRGWLDAGLPVERGPESPR